jgi:hypothetical protein
MTHCKLFLTFLCCFVRQCNNYGESPNLSHGVDVSGLNFRKLVLKQVNIVATIKTHVIWIFYESVFLTTVPWFPIIPRLFKLKLFLQAI